MVMNEAALIERDLNRDVWQEMLDAVLDIKEGRFSELSILDILEEDE